MKKAIPLLLLLVSATIDAKTPTVWKLDKPDIGYMVINYRPGHQVSKMQFLAEGTINTKIADKVSYKCNNEEEYKYLIPDQWVTCTIQPNDIAQVLLDARDFKNGATVVVNDLDN